MPSPFEPLDHGIINVPLSKRGNIDKQLDEYLAAKKQEERHDFYAKKAANEKASKEAPAMVKEVCDLIAKQVTEQHMPTVHKDNKKWISPLVFKKLTEINLIDHDAAKELALNIIKHDGATHLGSRSKAYKLVLELAA